LLQINSLWTINNLIQEFPELVYLFPLTVCLQCPYIDISKNMSLIKANYIYWNCQVDMMLNFIVAREYYSETLILCSRILRRMWFYFLNDPGQMLTRTMLNFHQFYVSVLYVFPEFGINFKTPDYGNLLGFMFYSSVLRIYYLRQQISFPISSWELLCLIAQCIFSIGWCMAVFIEHVICPCTMWLH
jgi:hypothetical protein